MKTGMLRTLENLMVAVTFAENNDHEYAMRVMNPEMERKNQKNQKKGLRHERENRPRIQL